MKKDLLLNNIFLKNKLAEDGIKQWWLAEQVGVDRKTVMRWVQGQVKSIQPENAQALCQILSCTIDELCTQDMTTQLATPQDQKIAAELLIQSSLVEKLGPIGEWDVIESLIKATIIPSLPADILGQLYNQLTVASWRQNKIDQAAVFNKKALEIADKTKDKIIRSQALLSLANIQSWRGRTKKSIEVYKECIALAKFIEPKTLGATYSNLGAVYYESGNLDLGEEYEHKSINIFLFHGRPMNLSISYGHLARITLMKHSYDKALIYTEKSIFFAKQDNYNRGLYLGNLLLAEIAAHKGDKLVAQEKLNQALLGYQSQNIHEGLNFEFAGRISRLIGNIEASKEYLLKGLELSNDFPVERAAIYAELTVTLSLLNENPKPALEEAIKLYKQAECDIKVKELKNLNF